MAQPSSRPPRRTPPQPFSQGQDPAVTSGLFWARLVTYRPLFLLGGLWTVFVGLSAIAYQGLTFNEPVEVYEEAPLTLPPAPPSVPEANTPEISTPEISIPEANTGEPDNSAPAAPESDTVALWGLVSLVGLCSFGCFVLTQQIKASARPKRKPKPAARPRPVAKAPQPQGPKRLAPYSPQRDGVVVPGGRIVESPQVESPRMEPPQVKSPLVQAPTQAPAAVPSPAPQKLKAPQMQTVPRRPLDPRALPPQPIPRAGAPAAPMHRPAPPPQPEPASGTSSPTTVVADGADLSLDYPEGSVAHALDVRQRRSLSSFM